MTNAIETVTCQWYQEGYPHPGCAEFGPPDRFVCHTPALWRITRDSVDFGESHQYVCGEHAVTMHAEVEAEAAQYGDVSVSVRPMTAGELAGRINPIDVGPETVDQRRFGDMYANDDVEVVLSAMRHAFGGVGPQAGCFACYCADDGSDGEVVVTSGAIIDGEVVWS